MSTVRAQLGKPVGEEDISYPHVGLAPCVDVEGWATRQHRDFEHGSPLTSNKGSGGGSVG